MKATVLGSGSFGTALACVLADKNVDVWIWARNKDISRGISEQHENIKYFPGIKLPDNIKSSPDMAECLKGTELIVVGIPSQSLTSVIRENINILPEGVPMVSAAKGIDRETLRLVSEIFEEELPGKYHKYLSYLSGPSFAKEILKKVPTVVSIASRNEDVAKQVQQMFAHTWFRTYWTPDVTGVEVGGALKNVIAIAAGVSDGLGLGHNTRAALITRGLAEITKLGVKKGADPLTFLGLAGLGDLVLTCTGDLSRNRTVGFKLGQGMKLKEILAEMNQVAEGVVTTESAFLLAKKLGVEMAITEQVHELLYKDKDPKLVVRDLMTRDLKRE
ncbi:MAG: NAD(P)-dependent glycerol-3-phosphate dehydrogenase [Leptospirales bacterium]|nr:NAD(P)-dependent glycerol-3-phosphate dehydrogenase [Leptospirales bacterium]